MNDIGPIDKYLRQNQAIKYYITEENLIIVQNPNFFHFSFCQICILTPLIFNQKTNNLTLCCLIIDSDKTIQLLAYGIALSDRIEGLLENMSHVLQSLYIQYLVLMDISLEKYFDYKDGCFSSNSSSSTHIYFMKPQILYTYKDLEKILNEADVELLKMYVNYQISEDYFLTNLSSSNIQNLLMQNKEKWIHQPNLTDYQTLSIEKIFIQIPNNVYLLSECINPKSLYELCNNLTNLMLKGYATLLKKKYNKSTLNTLERYKIIKKEEACHLSNYVLDFLLDESQNHLSRTLYYPSGIVPNWDFISKRLTENNQKCPALTLSDFPIEARRCYCSSKTLAKIAQHERKEVYNIQTVLKTLNTIEWDENSQKLFEEMINKIIQYGKKKTKVFTHPSRLSEQNKK